jgi:hypothetical protein
MLLINIYLQASGKPMQLPFVLRFSFTLNNGQFRHAGRIIFHSLFS